MNKQKLFGANTILKDILIEDLADDGKCVAKYENMVIFVKGLVPGDIADLQIIKKKKNFADAIPLTITHYSDKRFTPFCKHFEDCGGCKWQNIKYTDQLFYKQKNTEEGLRRIGKIDNPPINPIIPSPLTQYYRNKLEFTFSYHRWLSKKELDTQISNKNGLGFHTIGMFDKVVDVEHCHLQPSPSNDIRNYIKKYCIEKQLEFYNSRLHVGFLRTLTIRTTLTGEVMVILQVSEENKELFALLESIKEQFSFISSLYYVINKKKNDTFHDIEASLFFGKKFLLEKIQNLQFKVSPKSFYQTNPLQAENLYKNALRMANIQKEDVVYDLYTGTGTLALLSAEKAKKVCGIEIVPEAIQDAKENALMNNIENVFFEMGDTKKILQKDFFEKNGYPSIIITDPPRAGMDPQVIQTIIDSYPEKIVYISCNPSTQARDLSFFHNTYTITEIQPVDMFPHTHHIENIVLLEKNNK